MHIFDLNSKIIRRAEEFHVFSFVAYWLSKGYIFFPMKDVEILCDRGVLLSFYE